MLAVEPPEVLARLVPTEGDRQRVKAAAARIAGAREMTVESEAGTRLRCGLGSFRRSASTATWTSRGGGTTGPAGLR